MNQIDQAGPDDDRGIAIVGIAGRFPGCADLDDFWRLIVDGVEVLRDFDDAELEAAGVDAATRALPNFVPRGTPLEDADAFDAEFFGFSPREAEVIDPQHRVFLECAWQALEHAGHAPGSIEGPVGVYAGAGMNGYLIARLLRDRGLLELVGAYQLMIGNDKDFLCTRVSYKLGLQGPSVTVQTACSTSLVAVQMACQALLDGECDMALAGGVSIPYPSTTGHLHLDGMIFSPDGRCRPFDADAKGTRAGAGCGIVVLKRLADAIADGDTIHAVVRGAAVNNDGSGKAGYTAPSIDGQVEVVATAQALAGVEARSIEYVETHGTGTTLGDPIEVAALRRVFADGTDDLGFCALGSLKANLGHLDAAAGVAGLIKAVLVLKHRRIPPLVNFVRPNPLLELASSPFGIPTAAREWPRAQWPRRAGVSSFGIGGTNAHVVLEEWPEPPRDASGGPPDEPRLLVVSARSGSALQAASERLAAHIETHPEADLADVAWTLQAGRRAFAHRRAVVARDRDGAIAALRSASRSSSPARVHAGGERPVAFMFTGQGGQFAGMGATLYRRFAAFRATVDRCAESARATLGIDLRALMFDPSRTDIVETRYAQPALFAFETALARQWMAWGVAPVAMIGHSVGEFVAAHLAGVMSLEDALGLVVVRGRLMQSMAPGAMAGVQWNEPALREWLAIAAPGVEIAAVNAPELCTIAGPAPAVSMACEALSARGVETRGLRTSHAFHSASMDPAAEAFEHEVAAVALRPPSLRYLSNVTGRWITDAEATSPAYYARHLRRAVRFGDGLRTLAEDSALLMLEVGPGEALASIARAALGPDALHRTVASGGAVRDARDEDERLVEAAGRLWCCGVPLDWAAMRDGRPLRRVPLPTYPFERTRFGVSPLPLETREEGARGGLRREADVRDFFRVPTWTRSALAPRTPAGRWLVVGAGEGIVASLETALRNDGVDVESAAWGPAAVEAAKRMPRTPGTLRGAIVVDRAGSRTRSDRFFGLVALADALGASAECPVRIVVVVDGACSVLDEPVTDPDAAFVWGPVLALPVETAGLATRFVDVPLAGGAAVRQVIAEAGDPGDERQVAYRGRLRWVRRFEPVALDAPAPAGPSLPERAVVVITGGLGGMGLAVALRLAVRRSARLLLTSRTRLPPPGEWDAWLRDHPEGGRVAEAIVGVRAIEAAGGEVLVAAADVADEAAMGAAVDAARGRWGRIDALVHAAGVPGAGHLSVLKTPDELESAAAPKVEGLLTLARLLGGDALSKVVLMGSFNAWFGAPGVADYAAANAWLGAYAESDRWPAAWPRASCLEWSAWREVGMAATLQVPEDRRDAWNAYLAAGLSTDEALDAFERMLDAEIGRAVIAPFDPQRLAEAARRSAADAAGDADPQRPAPAQATVLDDTLLESDAQRTVAAIWSALLGVERIAPDDTFGDLGGHSLMVMRSIAMIEEQTGVRLPPQRLIFETLADIAAVLDQAGSTEPAPR